MSIFNKASGWIIEYVIDFEPFLCSMHVVVYLYMDYGVWHSIDGVKQGKAKKKPSNRIVFLPEHNVMVKHFCRWVWVICFANNIQEYRYSTTTQCRIWWMVWYSLFGIMATFIAAYGLIKHRILYGRVFCFICVWIIVKLK